MESTITVTRPYRLATAEDLDFHRSTLERLYKQTTLPKLVDIMIKEHGLKPTYNMLRKRFGRWGLDNKKNNEREMRVMVHKMSERSRIGKASTFRVRGRCVQYQDIVRYWERKHMSIDDVLAQITSRESTPDGLEVVTPVPSPVLQPAELEIPERILRGISDYIFASFESGMWFSEKDFYFCRTRKDPKLRNGTTTPLYNAAAMAFHLLKRKRFAEGGRRLIWGTAFIKGLVITENPDIFPVTTSILYESLKFGFPEVGIAIIRQFSSMGEVLFGQYHPISHIFALLATISISQLGDLINICLFSMRDSFETWLGFSHTTTVQVFRRYSSTLSPGENQVQKVRSALNRLETVLGATNGRCVSMRKQLARSLFQIGSYDEIEAECSKMFQVLDNMDSLGYGKELRLYALYYLSRVYAFRKDYYHAKNLIQKAIAQVTPVFRNKSQVDWTWLLDYQRELTNIGRRESVMHN